MIYIGIDPGVHEFAYAIVNNDNPKLKLDCGFCKTRKYELAGFYKNYLEIIEFPAVAHIIIETPDRIDRYVNPLDIIRLAIATGEIIGFFNGRSSFHDIIKVDPKKWKGQVPKKVTQDRVLEKMPQVKTKLLKIAKSKRHHLYDAFGMVLWGIKQNE